MSENCPTITGVIARATDRNIPWSSAKSAAKAFRLPLMSFFLSHDAKIKTMKARVPMHEMAIGTT